MRSLDEFDQQTKDWQDAYLEGSADGIREAEMAVPPLLRRFFWWDKEGLTFPWKLLYFGGDEYCNDTIGIRLKGGVLFIRRNLRVRLEPHPACPKCTPEGS